MAISPKVSAATVGASVTTMVIGIVGPHLFPHGMPTDVQGLIGAGVTAAITFASGYFARHDVAVAKVVKTAEQDVAKADVVFTKVKEATAPQA